MDLRSWSLGHANPDTGTDVLGCGRLHTGRRLRRGPAPATTRDSGGAASGGPPAGECEAASKTPLRYRGETVIGDGHANPLPSCLTCVILATYRRRQQ